MTKAKGIIVTILIVILLIVLAADVAAVLPNSLPWILGVFASVGVYKFARLLFLWLTTEDTPIPIRFPRHRKRFDWSKVWAGTKDGDA